MSFGFVWLNACGEGRNVSVDDLYLGSAGNSEWLNFLLLVNEAAFFHFIRDFLVCFHRFEFTSLSLVEEEELRRM